ncbi:MAG: ribosomal-protein-alanine N-acetyltransferase [Maribacter sp.]|jgi:ribosomal-protein-alanine N-acetyltransferase
MIIHSTRLIIRTAIDTDFPFLLSFYNKKENMQFIQSGKHDWTLESLQDKWKKMHISKHIGLRTVVLKDNNTIIGEAGLLQIPKKNETFIEIGYMIDRVYWNNAYGFEIANSLVQYAKDEMQLKELKAGVNSKNTASIKILEKCDFKLFNKIKTKNGGIYFLYRLVF